MATTAVGGEERTVYDSHLMSRLTWCGDIMNDLVRFLESKMSKR